MDPMEAIKSFEGMKDMQRKLARAAFDDAEGGHLEGEDLAK